MATMAGKEIEALLSKKGIDIAMEVGTDLVIKVAIDSLMAKPTPKITFKVKELVTRGLINGIYITFVKGALVIAISKNKTVNMIIGFFLDVFVRSVAEVFIRMFLNYIADKTDLEDVIGFEKESFTMAKVFIQNVTSAVLVEIYYAIRNISRGQGLTGKMGAEKKIFARL